MLLPISWHCVALRHSGPGTSSSGESTRKPRLVHKLALGFDVLLGITALAIGILNLTSPSLGIGLSATAEGALVGAGALYLGLALINVLSFAKLFSRFKGQYLC